MASGPERVAAPEREAGVPSGPCGRAEAGPEPEVASPPAPERWAAVPPADLAESGAGIPSGPEEPAASGPGGGPPVADDHPPDEPAASRPVTPAATSGPAETGAKPQTLQ
ncbi:hypothetical protein BKA01_000216 [Pseudonocardia eucalypti]|uniref:hypothetical protein n=1 Tax=Pseudonocardia eucalypti TaxID=648755 RepID=UPI0017E20F1F|nr:hypothetical protein [Pseudonocardia eucalypti]